MDFSIWDCAETFQSVWSVLWRHCGCISFLIVGYDCPFAKKYTAENLCATLYYTLK